MLVKLTTGGDVAGPPVHRHRCRQLRRQRPNDHRPRHQVRQSARGSRILLLLRHHCKVELC